MSANAALEQGADVPLDANVIAARVGVLQVCLELAQWYHAIQLVSETVSALGGDEHMKGMKCEDHEACAISLCLGAAKMSAVRIRKLRPDDWAEIGARAADRDRDSLVQSGIEMDRSAMRCSSRIP